MTEDYLVKFHKIEHRIRRLVKTVNFKNGESEWFICWSKRGLVTELFIIWKASNRSNLLPFLDECRIFIF